MANVDPAQIYSLIQRYFPPDQWGNAWAVANAETSNLTQFENDRNPKRERSYGPFQVNINVHNLTREQAMDPEQNVKYAAALWRSEGWRPWTTAQQMGLAGSDTHLPAPGGGGGKMDEDYWGELYGQGGEEQAAGGGGGGGDEVGTTDYYQSEIKASQDRQRQHAQSMADAQAAMQAADEAANAAKAKGDKAAQDRAGAAFGDAYQKYQGAQNDLKAEQGRERDATRLLATAKNQQAQREWQGGQGQITRDWQNAQRQATQAYNASQQASDRALQYQMAQMSNDIAKGRLGLDEAQARFGQAMANRQAQQARQQMAMSGFGQANQLVLEGSKWAAPKGMTHFPGFEPGKGSVLGVLGGLLGAQVNPLPIERIGFDPRGDVERILRGGYNQPDIAGTVGGGGGGGGYPSPGPAQAAGAGGVTQPQGWGQPGGPTGTMPAPGMPNVMPSSATGRLFGEEELPQFPGFPAPAPRGWPMPW